MTFSTKRVAHLLRVFAITQKRSVLVTAGAAYAVMLAFFLFGMLAHTGWGTGLEFHQVFFPSAFFLVGLVAVSMSFAGMHRADRSYIYLTLPASGLEKLVEKLLLAIVIYPVAAVVTYFLFSLLLAGLAPLLFDASFVVFNPAAIEPLDTYHGFIVASSLFLFGAAYFRSRHFIKTALSVAGIFILLSTVGTFAGVASISGLVADIEVGLYDQTTASAAELRALGDLAGTIARSARFAALWILPPALWALTWLKLRETEVSDAVR